MNISDMVEQLNKIHDKHGDMPVMFEGLGGSQLSIAFVSFRMAEADEFPRRCKMPKGSKFVSLINDDLLFN